MSVYNFHNNIDILREKYLIIRDPFKLYLDIFLEIWVTVKFTIEELGKSKGGKQEEHEEKYAIYKLTCSFWFQPDM